MSATRSSSRAATALGLLLVLFLAGGFTLDRLGPALPALDLRWPALLLAGLAVALVPRRARHSAPVVPRAACALLVAWAVWLMLSAAWAPPRARRQENVTDLLVMVIAVLLVWQVAARAPDLRVLVDRMWRWLYWIAVVYLAAALAAGPGIQGRYSAFGGGPNVFVRIMVFGMAASVVRARQGHPRALVAAPGFALGAALSGSRGGLLAGGVVGLVLLVPLARLLPRKVVVRSALVMLATVLVCVAAVPPVRRFVVMRFVEQTAEAQYGAGRGSIFRDTWQIVLDHPWVGAGLDSYYALVGRIAEFEHPHNLLLATAADGGAVGAGLLVLAVVALTRAVHRHRPLDLSVLMLLGTGWFVLVASMFSGSYYDSRFAWWFLALATLLTQVPKGAPEGAAPEVPGGRAHPRWWAQERSTPVSGPQARDAAAAGRPRPRT